MVGKYRVEVYNNRVHYQFEIKRNITIIQGNSATGKTTLINLIANYERLGAGSGVSLICEKECSVLNVNDWKHYLETSHDKIIFADENVPYIKTKEFADALKRSDNYFVLIYRDSLPQLAYSVEEIYGMRIDRSSQKYVNAKRVFNELYSLYNLSYGERVYPDKVITEDSNSGFEMYSRIFMGKCISANGKSKIANELLCLSSEDRTILIIVDGAAFGADVQKVMNMIYGKKQKIVLYAPESFEFLILKSGIVSIDKRILTETYLFADSKYYVSWEDFFTKYLVENTANSPLRYAKAKLNKSYLVENNIARLKAILPDVIALPE